MLWLIQHVDIVESFYMTKIKVEENKVNNNISSEGSEEKINTIREVFSPSIARSIKSLSFTICISQAIVREKMHMYGKYLAV